MSIVERAYNNVYPTAEQLWERGGAVMDAGVPYFPKLEIVGRPTETTQPLYMRDGMIRRRIGATLLLGYETNDGIDRLARLNLLDDKYRSDVDLLAVSGTAWTTRPHKGYAKRRDDRTARELGIDTMTVGAEGSTNERTLPGEVRDTISLAKSGQSEEMILAHAMQKYGLSRRHYARSDSRDGMIEPARVAHAPRYGIEKVFSDIRAICAPDRIEHGDIGQVGLWLGVEAMGAAAVGATLLAERDLGLVFGTFETHPRSLVVAFDGIMQALASGEAGRLAEAAPDSMLGHVALYGYDVLSPDERWREIYQPKLGVVMRTVPRGSHAHLLTRTDLQFGRLERAVHSLRYDAALDTDYVINGHKPEYEKQADLRLVAN